MEKDYARTGANNGGGFDDVLREERIKAVPYHFSIPYNEPRITGYDCVIATETLKYKAQPQRSLQYKTGLV